MRRPRSTALRIAGAVGALEAVVEDIASTAPPKACLVVCHPHPLHGGTMQNKVVTTLARAAPELGVPSLRFNFRGVGASEGAFDDGRGETDDTLAAICAAQQRWPGAALWLAGFSFGGHVALRTSTQAGVEAASLITVAPAFTRYYASPSQMPVPACPWLVIQGDADEVINSTQVLSWCEALQPAPQTAVLPGVGHFFHGHLNTLCDIALTFWRVHA
jgi:alpha/beta superfamily hydrolase